MFPTTITFYLKCLFSHPTYYTPYVKHTIWSNTHWSKADWYLP